MESLYDVIVVGSGPGGSTAAYELARRGWRVLLLERARLPRYKTCAGGIPRKVAEILDYDLTPVIETEIRRGLVSYRSGPPLEIPFEHIAGWTVMRSRFDHFLAQRAVAAGAILLEGMRVRDVHQGEDNVAVVTREGVFRGRMLVGADGANSLVARRLNLSAQPQAAIALESEAEVDRETLARYEGTVHFDFGEPKHGYGWIFAKSDHLSIGVGIFVPVKAPDLREHLTRFGQKQGLWRDADRVQACGHPIPLGGVAAELHTRRCLLVGDAAGLADPFLGEGIYYAIRSAQIAGQVMDQTLRAGSEDLSEYTRRINAEIVRDLTFARRIGRYFYAFPYIGYRVFCRSPVVRGAMAHVIEGTLGWEDLWHHFKRGFWRVVLDLLRAPHRSG